MASGGGKGKKGAPVAEKPLLGRVTANVTAGLVGLPNVGKSSTFNLMCGMSVPAENFPFCTIDPSVSRVRVPDDRFDRLCQMYSPASEKPAHLKVTDIAGLVKGAAEGAGLGNAFLSHIRSTDAIYQVVRCFEDDEVVHVEDSVDPVRDLQIIADELRVKDLEWVEKEYKRLEHVVARVDKTKKKQLETVTRLFEWLKAGHHARHGEWSADDIEVLNEMMLLTSKPTIYLVNLSARDFQRKKNKWLPKLAAWVKEHGGEPVIPLSVAFEQELVDAGSPEAQAAIEEEAGTKSALPKIVTLGYHTLRLIHFFTAGTDEVRAWTVRRGTKAPAAAGTIHTDMERGFIKAETMKYDDLVATMEEGGLTEASRAEAAVRSGGKLAMNGKEYVVQDGDIMFIKFNVTTKSKK